MSASVVVDTTVWIDFFRGRNELVRRHLRQLVRAQRAVLAGIVMAEVLQGIRSPSEQRQVEDHFTALRYVEVTQATWRSAAELAQALRGKGKTLPLSDLLIAALAAEHDCAVFSTDPHFTLIPHLTIYDASEDITT